MPAKKEISLLPDEENPNSPSARFLRWITTIGRFIIVFTELIVISAFLSRFWLDRKNSDYSEVLRQHKAILESTQEFEQEYSLLQQRLKVIKDFYSKTPEYNSKIASLAESTPNGIVFNNLTLENNTDKKSIVANIDLISLREESIIDLITNLTVNENIKTVDVKSIEKKPKENKYSVKLYLVFKPDKKT
ncbi:MAG: hypothetical protein WC841_00365 [Candidatus Shapirobacteria bacterium]|jgi:Tfp pilus assembly protein PilN